MNKEKSKIALYVHIPFCVQKCAYCNFCSFVPKSNNIESYIKSLLKEIEIVGSHLHQQVFSIYIGGGTPSILPIGAVSQILESIGQHFDVLPNASVTIEANPNSFTKEKAIEYSLAKINRISFGLQSASPTILKILNRAHSAQDLIKAVSIAKVHGFIDINVDVMLGVPTQSLKDVKDTLNQVVALPITHISAYGLILEEGTPLYRKVKQGELSLPTEDETVDMYDYTVAFLENKGFFRYEISNFAKRGFESVHNQNYWNRGEYVGVGLNAYSFVAGIHYQNTADLTNYCDYITRGELPIVEKEHESKLTAQNETIMLALRTTKGLNIDEFNKMFKLDFCNKFHKQLEKLLKNDLIALEGGFLRIKNMYVSNAIITEFFE